MTITIRFGRVMLLILLLIVIAIVVNLAMSLVHVDTVHALYATPTITPIPLKATVTPDIPDYTDCCYIELWRCEYIFMPMVTK